MERLDWTDGQAQADGGGGREDRQERVRRAGGRTPLSLALNHLIMQSGAPNNRKMLAERGFRMQS